MSGMRARLVQALKAHDQAIRLFAVGDDWQSIYRFAGSDITAMTQFEQRFGFTRTVALSQTFRANQGITDVASEFIRKNPAQLAKNVVATSSERSGVIRVLMHSGNPAPALINELRELGDRVTGERVTSVGILGRYNFLEPDSLPRISGLKAEFTSIHRAKGREWDAVIVLGVTNKRGQDFPATKQDPPELALFLPAGDAMTFAEERRLFYVALTRAKHRVILMVPKTKRQASWWNSKGPSMEAQWS
jgi:DNA helicase-4